jgi:hypothetical protein
VWRTPPDPEVFLRGSASLRENPRNLAPRRQGAETGGKGVEDSAGPGGLSPRLGVSARESEKPRAKAPRRGDRRQGCGGLRRTRRSSSAAWRLCAGIRATSRQGAKARRPEGRVWRTPPDREVFFLRGLASLRKNPRNLAPRRQGAETGGKGVEDSAGPGGLPPRLGVSARESEKPRAKAPRRGDRRERCRGLRRTGRSSSSAAWRLCARIRGNARQGAKALRPEGEVWRTPSDPEVFLRGSASLREKPRNLAPRRQGAETGGRGVEDSAGPGGLLPPRLGVSARESGETRAKAPRR